MNTFFMIVSLWAVNQVEVDFDRTPTGLCEKTSNAIERKLFRFELYPFSVKVQQVECAEKTLPSWEFDRRP